MAPYWRKELPSSEGAPPSDLCFLLTTSFPDLVISCKWYNMFYFSIYPIAPVSPYTQLHLLGSHIYPKLPSAVFPWLHKIGILLPPIFPNRRLHSSDFPCNKRSTGALYCQSTRGKRVARPLFFPVCRMHELWYLLWAVKARLAWSHIRDKAITPISSPWTFLRPNGIIQWWGDEGTAAQAVYFKNKNNCWRNAQNDKTRRRDFIAAICKKS